MQLMRLNRALKEKRPQYHTENELGSLLARDSGVTRPEILTSNCHTLVERRRHLGDHAPIASSRKSAKLIEADRQLLSVWQISCR